MIGVVERFEINRVRIGQVEFVRNLVRAFAFEEPLIPNCRVRADIQHIFGTFRVQLHAVDRIKVHRIRMSMIQHMNDAGFIPIWMFPVRVRIINDDPPEIGNRMNGDRLCEPRKHSDRQRGDQTRDQSRKQPSALFHGFFHGFQRRCRFGFDRRFHFLVCFSALLAGFKVFLYKGGRFLARHILRNKRQ